MHRSGERLRRSGGRLHCVVIGSFRFLLTFSIGRLGCLSNLNTLGSLCIFLKIKFATPAGSGTFLSLRVNFGSSQTRRMRGASVFTTFSNLNVFLSFLHPPHIPVHASACFAVAALFSPASCCLESIASISPGQLSFLPGFVLQSFASRPLKPVAVPARLPVLQPSLFRVESFSSPPSSLAPLDWRSPPLCI